MAEGYFKAVRIFTDISSMRIAVRDASRLYFNGTKGGSVHMVVDNYNIVLLLTQR